MSLRVRQGVVAVVAIAAGLVLSVSLSIGSVAPQAAPAASVPPQSQGPGSSLSEEPSPSGPKIVVFGPSGTQAQFVSLMNDMSVDVIEMTAGTYRGWHLGASTGGLVVNRAARPLLVRPAPGAAVVWDDTGGTSGDSFLHWLLNVASEVTNYITFDPAGTGGASRFRTMRSGSVA